MALSPPSLQKTYEAFYSRDPAFDPPEPADADAWSKYLDRVRVARETGNWRELVAPGKTATVYKMRPIPGSAFRALCSLVEAKKIDALSLVSLSFRAAIQSVIDPEVKIDVSFAPADGLPEFERAEIGKIARRSVVDELDAIDQRIVGELGTEAFSRAQALAPRS